MLAQMEESTDPTRMSSFPLQAQHLHTLWLCGDVVPRAELPVSLQEGLRQLRGLFPASQDVVQDGASLVLRESMVIALP